MPPSRESLGPSAMISRRYAVQTVRELLCGDDITEPGVQRKRDSRGARDGPGKWRGRPSRPANASGKGHGRRRNGDFRPKWACCRSLTTTGQLDYVPPTSAEVTLHDCNIDGHFAARRSSRDLRPASAKARRRQIRRRHRRCQAIPAAFAVGVPRVPDIGQARVGPAMGCLIPRAVRDPDHRLDALVYHPHHLWTSDPASPIPRSHSAVALPGHRRGGDLGGPAISMMRIGSRERPGERPPHENRPCPSPCWGR